MKKAGKSRVKTMKSATIFMKNKPYSNLIMAKIKPKKVDFKKQLQKDFRCFFDKLYIILLTGSYKYRKLPSLIFSCTNRIAMTQHFNTGFSKRFLIKGIANAKAKNP